MSLPHVCNTCHNRRRIYRTVEPGVGWWPCPACYLASDGEYTSVDPMTDPRALCWHVLGYVPMDGGVSEAQAMEWVERQTELHPKGTEND